MLRAENTTLTSGLLKSVHHDPWPTSDGLLLVRDLRGGATELAVKGDKEASLQQVWAWDKCHLGENGMRSLLVVFQAIPKALPGKALTSFT